MIFVINDLPLNNLGKNIINLSKKQYLIIQKKIKLKIDRDFNHPLKCIF